MTTNRNFPGRTIGAGITTTTAGYAITQLPLDNADLTGTALLLAGGAAAVIPAARWVRARSTSQGTIGRWAERDRRHDGLASARDHRKVSSRQAMWRLSTTVRPSLAQMSPLARLRVPITAYATELAVVGGRRVYSSSENVTLRVGGPRTGKTGEMICRVVDAPGAAVVTSTRTDIFEWTYPSRSAAGPIHVFNPSNLGDLATTIKWSPLIGCQNPSVAQRRADDMIPSKGSSEGERWDIQARRVLKILMHAAALNGFPMRAVLSWVSDPGQDSAQDVHRALSLSPEAAMMQMDARQFFGTNERTKTSITATLMPVLSWLSDAGAAQVGDPPVTEAGEDLFDVPGMLRDNGTVYLLGAEDGLTAPLIAGLTAEIAHQARILAAGRPSGRLDPPLTVALDEAALICPVPLDRWTADMGGRGVTIHISVQSRAQLRARWGDQAAAAILNNCAAIMVYGGTRDPDDLAAWSVLSGERRDQVTSRNEKGAVSGTAERAVPVLSPAGVANLPKGYVLIILRGMPACIGRPRMAWERRDIKRMRKARPYIPTPSTAFETAARLEQQEPPQKRRPSPHPVA